MEERTALKRRGILAAAAAVVAGIAMKQTSEPVLAAAVVLGGLNSATAGTSITVTSGSSFGGSAFLVDASQDGTACAGLWGIGSGSANGVIATGGVSNGPGLFAHGGGGINPSNGIIALAGDVASPSTTAYCGVYAEGGSSQGVIGRSSGTDGVLGVITSTATNGTHGVIGINAASGSSGIGVAGYGNGSSNGYGVFGYGPKSFGGWFEGGTAPGGGGVVGIARTAGTVGFQALAVSPATYAGFFTGTVSINGSLGVSGGKFAVVKGQDGQYRGMYAVESPECWFEDFGKAKLVNGSATVKLDPLFAQHVHADDYHVFLTAYSNTNGLHVTSQSATDFAIEEHNGGKSNLTFSYRVVAKRNDIKGERMPIWEMPAAPQIPDPPKPAPPPAPAKKP